MTSSYAATTLRLADLLPGRSRRRVRGRLRPARRVPHPPGQTPSGRAGRAAPQSSQPPLPKRLLPNKFGKSCRRSQS